MKNCYGLLIFLFIFQNIQNAEISTDVNYEHGGWVGEVECQFHYQSYCEMSIHVCGQRISINDTNARQEVFVSCYSPDTAIVLAISNFTYNDVQEYTCLQDKTMEYASKWMTAYPDLIVNGVEEEGSTVSLTCNLFIGAPLYWVFPNEEEENRDVTIINSYNDVNTTTTIVFNLEANDNFAEYKCCVEVKDSQYTDTPCATHTFRFNKVGLVSYTEDYSTQPIFLECDFGGDPPPNTNLIEWISCSNGANSTQCVSYTPSSNSIDGYKIKSQLTDIIYENQGTYGCLYDGNVSHVFDVMLGTYPPIVSSIDKQIFYSSDGMAVQLTCHITSSLPLTVTWKKSNDLESSSGSEIISSNDSYSIDTNLIQDSNWQSVLFIHPYDANVHNVNYTCEANNELGKEEYQTDTTLGPSDLTFNLYDGNNSEHFRGVCSYKAFPQSENYQFTVVSALEVEILYANTTYDYQTLYVTAEIEYIAATPFIINCLAFNRFDPLTAQASFSIAR